MADYFLEARSVRATKSISCNTTTAAVALDAGFEGPLEIYNSTAAVAFVNTAPTGTATAAATNYPIPPGQSRTIDQGPVASVAAILSTGTGTVYVTELV